MTYGILIENQDQRVLIDSDNYINLYFDTESTIARGSTYPPAFHSANNSLMFAQPVIPSGQTYPYDVYISGRNTFYTDGAGFGTSNIWYNQSATWPSPANYKVVQYKLSSTKSRSNSGYGLQVFSSANTLVLDSAPENRAMNIIATGSSSNSILLGTFSNLNKIYCCINNCIYHTYYIPPVFVETFYGFRYRWTSNTTGNLYAYGQTRAAGSTIDIGFREQYLVIEEKP